LRKIGAPPAIPGVELSVIKLNTLATSGCGGPRLHRIFHGFRTRSRWPQPSAKTSARAGLPGIANIVQADSVTNLEFVLERGLIEISTQMPNPTYSVTNSANSSATATAAATSPTAPAATTSSRAFPWPPNGPGATAKALSPAVNCPAGGDSTPSNSLQNCTRLLHPPTNPIGRRGTKISPGSDWYSGSTGAPERLVRSRRSPGMSPNEQEIGQFLRAVADGRMDEVKARLHLVNATGPHPFFGGRPQALHLAIENWVTRICCAI